MRCAVVSIEYVTLLALTCTVVFLAHHNHDGTTEQVVLVSVLPSPPPPPPLGSEKMLAPLAPVIAAGRESSISSTMLLPPPPPPPPPAMAMLDTSQSSLTADAVAHQPHWKFPLPLPPLTGGGDLPSCAEANGWDDSHFSADQDWVLSTNGKRPGRDTLWRWVPNGGGKDWGRLQNIATGGHMNARPGGFIRGHGNENGPPRRPAGALDSTLLERVEIDYSRYQTSQVGGRPCTWGRGQRYYAFRFLRSPGSGYAHVLDDGSMHAEKQHCTDDPACLFILEPPRPGNGAGSSLGSSLGSVLGDRGGGQQLVVRSVLTGGLLRMVDDHHPGFDGWDGVRRPKARHKERASLAKQRAAARLALSSEAAVCPLLPAARKHVPAGWLYNTSIYAPLVKRALAPWYDGGVSATAVDLAFFHEMYPYQNRHERPTLHVSVKGAGAGKASAVRAKWQPAAPRRKEELAARPTAGRGAPHGSADAAFLRMLSYVSELVELPSVEFVAHTASLPKVPAQNLELVLGPSTDEAHNDVPAPAAWLYEALLTAAKGGAEAGGGGDGRGRGEGGGGRGGGERGSQAQTHACDKPLHAASQGATVLCVFASCRGPAEGHRGPLWQYYPPHRVALLASTPPLKGRLMAKLAAPCVGPGLEDLPLEAAWDKLASAELRSRVIAEVWEPPSPAADDAVACAGGNVHASCIWELILDEDGAPKRLFGALRRGALVFRQWSPYQEFFHALLRPWVHYIPVADSLADLAERLEWADRHPDEVRKIRAAAQGAMSRINLCEVACFWWQLLTALAPLQDFEPRTDERRLGFNLVSVAR